ncbi:SfnB family sulfur acquisition oxidoreductase [Conexibacter arvalis]|uniref:Dibenzothiophene monooxygenase n=1 Tax=Conexibacter arvalis TaxID=912552 RepID=A0A840IDS9_9ACTN|nr:SfnB family sulfur acquisition oxidoreductase [Conexibacter arvalis]MBB4662188.1 SfnB family sulfur acquisition oxidoreductase [Conexibacter arvalis]
MTSPTADAATAADGTAAGATVARLASGDRAVAAAHAVAEQVRAGAVARDREHALPHAELELLRRSGLLALSVPAEHGGVGASHVVIAEVFRILAAADPAFVQIVQPHVAFVDAVRRFGTPAQQAFFFGEAVAGRRFGNALSERGTKHARDYRTRLTRDPAGGWRLNGAKYYSTGALGADWIAVFAAKDDGELVFAYVPGDAPGVAVDQDWTAFGQRSTLSGTTTLDEVHVPDEHVLDYGLAPAAPRPTISGAFPQLQHAAIDVGIARGALEDGIAFVRTRARPWPDAEVERAADEQATQLHYGRLTTLVHAAEQLLRRAAELMDVARDEGGEAAVTAARLGVAEAKAFGGEVALEVATAIFESAGSSGVDAKHGLDRHWRNARTHTLHDPNRWKYIHVGNFVLNGVAPSATNHVI